jgi:hypothetical protein
MFKLFYIININLTQEQSSSKNLMIFSLSESTKNYVSRSSGHVLFDKKSGKKKLFPGIKSDLIEWARRLN